MRPPDSSFRTMFWCSVKINGIMIAAAVPICLLVLVLYGYEAMCYAAVTIGGSFGLFLAVTRIRSAQ